MVHQSPDRALVAGWRGVRGPLGRWCGLFGYDRACRPARVAGEERAGLGSRRALELFGSRYVFTHGAWLPLDTEFGRGADSIASAWYLHGEYGLPRNPRFVELDEERPRVVQRFRPSRAGFDGLVAHFAARDVPNGARVVLRLRESDGPMLSESLVNLTQLRQLPGARLECIIATEPQAASALRTYELEIERVPGTAGTVGIFRAVGSPADPDDAESPLERDGWQLANERRQLRGRIVLDLSYQSEDFTRVGEYDGLTLHRFERGGERARLVHKARAVEGLEAALSAVVASDFNPRREVVLERQIVGTDTEHSVAGDHVELVHQTPSSSNYRVTSSAPGFLVLSQAYFPGWSATVNGREVEVERANAAFCAVEVPSDTCEVTLTYRPLSSRIGLALTALGALVVALLVHMGRPRGTSPAIGS